MNVWSRAWCLSMMVWAAACASDRAASAPIKPSVATGASPGVAAPTPSIGGPAPGSAGTSVDPPSAVSGAGGSAASPPEPGISQPDGPKSAEPACLSGGSGGAMQDLLMQSFTDSGGLSGLYHVYASRVTPGTPIGALIYFHGDGADEFDNPGYGLDEITAQAAANHLLMVALRTPDTATTTWWQNGDRNATWARELIEKQIFARYAIDRSRVLLVGYSGGSEFIAGNLVPDHSALMCGGGALMFGGGTPPWGAGSMFARNFVSHFKMHWYSGLDDTGCSACSCDGFNALTASTDGSNYYKKLGFSVSLEQPAGIDHCNIPFADVLKDQLAKGIVSPP